MGGGGLDYYDPSLLVKLNLRCARAIRRKKEMAKLKAEGRGKRRKAWDAIRGTPEGLKKAADGRPTQRPFRVAYEKATKRSPRFELTPPRVALPRTGVA